MFQRCHFYNTKLPKNTAPPRPRERPESRTARSAGAVSLRPERLPSLSRRPPPARDGHRWRICKYIGTADLCQRGLDPANRPFPSSLDGKKLPGNRNYMERDSKSKWWAGELQNLGDASHKSPIRHGSLPHWPRASGSKVCILTARPGLAHPLSALTLPSPRGREKWGGTQWSVVLCQF